MTTHRKAVPKRKKKQQNLGGGNSGQAGICPVDGKQRYVSRKLAKQAMLRLWPEDRMSVYPCGEYWHFGHLAESVRQGKISREKVHGKSRNPRATD